MYSWMDNLSLMDHLLKQRCLYWCWRLKLPIILKNYIFCMDKRILWKYWKCLNEIKYMVILTVHVQIFSSEHYYIIIDVEIRFFFSKRFTSSFLIYMISSVHVLGLTNILFIWILKVFCAPHPKCLCLYIFN
jgi:hypothetical protein